MLSRLEILQYAKCSKTKITTNMWLWYYIQRKFLIDIDCSSDNNSIFFWIEANMNIQLAIQCSNISTYVTFLLTFSCFISSFLILIPLMIRFLLTLRWFYYDYYCFLLIFFSSFYQPPSVFFCLLLKLCELSIQLFLICLNQKRINVYSI